VEDFNTLDGKKKQEDSKKDEDPNNATNYPDDKNKAQKVTPGDAIEEEDDNLKTEQDSPLFVKKLGIEPYIGFAEFAKYLSLFN